jgi:predicted metal-dependent RNase
MQGKDNKTNTLKINLEVLTVEGLSGHSDRNRLINYVYHLNTKPERIIVLHTDNSKAGDFTRALHKMFKVETLAPRDLEVVRLK